MSETILLGQGGGGRLSRDLIDAEIVARFGDGPLRGLPDAASIALGGETVIFSTDSFVVSPLEFPGGSIGHLAVHGTVNDVAAAGGRPRFLSLSLIIEEGLPLATLRRVLDDVRRAADACGVAIATGDTKVVARGQADGLYVNTAGIGGPIEGLQLARERIRTGDVVLASGSLGDHGLAIMAAREGIAIEGGPRSDTGPVHRLVECAAEVAGAALRFMRDPTRGGAAAVLNEAVEGLGVGIEIDEAATPASPGGRAVAEMLGLDLLHVASEGRLLVVCAADAADDVLAVWRELDEGRGACRMGRVTSDGGRVILNTAIGGRRLVDVPRGELLPRIC